MPGELKFNQPITDDELPDVETLSISEEGGRIRVCMDSPGLMFTGTFRLTVEQEAELYEYLGRRRGGD